MSITATPMPPTAPSPPAQESVAKAITNANQQVIRYAAAVLKGQPDMMEHVASCFASDGARVKKQQEPKFSMWILESSEFASCTTGEQVFPIADEIVSRIHRILALYCGTTPMLSVAYISWINAEGEPKRNIRGISTLNVISSKEFAELKEMSGAQPLGSAVFQAIVLDPAVKEALILHGDDALGWPQIYDIIEFLGGVAGVVKAGYATDKQTRSVKQTANHYRHLGSPKKNPLPPTPSTLAQAGAFARGLLKLWIASRL